MRTIKRIWSWVAALVLLALGLPTADRARLIWRGRRPTWLFGDGSALPVMAGGTVMLETMKAAKGIDPVADAFAGTVQSDVYALRDWQRILFIQYVGVGATGTSVITIESCDDVVPTNTTTIPFWYREITSGDTDAAWVRAAAAGFTTTAGSSRIALIEVDAKDLDGDDAFVRMNLVEGVNSPVLGGLMVLAGIGRYNKAANATILS